MSPRSACRVLGACLALPALAHAAATSCTVTITNVAFGDYDVFTKTDTKANGDVKIKCTASVSYTISLSTGSGTYTTRIMKSGSNELDYNLYTTTQDLTVWGNGTSGTATEGATSTGATYTVYGMIPSLQNVPVGSYSDTITVTVKY